MWVLWFAFVVKPKLVISKAEESAFKARAAFITAESAFGSTKALTSAMLYFVASEVFTSMVFAFCERVELIAPAAVSKAVLSNFKSMELFMAATAAVNWVSNLRRH